MVTKKIDTRSLSLELAFTALQLNVRVNVEISDWYGDVRRTTTLDRKACAAISETLQLHSDFFRFEVTKDLPKSIRAREKLFEQTSEIVSSACFSERWKDHNRDQLDLFDQAGLVGENLMTYGLLVSPTDDEEVVILGPFNPVGSGIKN